MRTPSPSPQQRQRVWLHTCSPTTAATLPVTQCKLLVFMRRYSGGIWSADDSDTERGGGGGGRGGGSRAQAAAIPLSQVVAASRVAAIRGATATVGGVLLFTIVGLCPNITTTLAAFTILRASAAAFCMPSAVDRSRSSATDVAAVQWRFQQIYSMVPDARMVPLAGAADAVAHYPASLNTNGHDAAAAAWQIVVLFVCLKTAMPCGKMTSSLAWHRCRRRCSQRPYFLRRFGE